MGAVARQETELLPEVKSQAEKQAKKFMKSARTFLATKLTGDPKGKIPEEFELNLILLESYYKTFIMLDLQINSLDSIVVLGKYGYQPSALLTIRDRACVRLESLMKSLGLTIKSGKALGTTEVQKTLSPLEHYFNNQGVEKR